MKNKTVKQKRPTPKRALRLPDLDYAKTTVLNTLSYSDSRRSYRFAVDDLVAWYCSEPRLAFGKTVVLRYRLELEGPPFGLVDDHLRLAAVRRLAFEASVTRTVRMWPPFPIRSTMRSAWGSGITEKGLS